MDTGPVYPHDKILSVHSIRDVLSAARILEEKKKTHTYCVVWNSQIRSYGFEIKHPNGQKSVQLILMTTLQQFTPPTQKTCLPLVLNQWVLGL